MNKSFSAVTDEKSMVGGSFLRRDLKPDLDGRVVLILTHNATC